MSETTLEDRIRKRSQARREREKEELRAAILRTASELIAETGFEGFSLRQVAERIGYSPTTIYLYFENKDDLLFAIAVDGFEVFGAKLDAARQGRGDTMERLEAIGRAYVEFGLEHPVAYRLMFVHRPEFLGRPTPGHGGGGTVAFDALFGTVEQLMREGFAARHDAMQVSLLLWSGVHGIVMMAHSLPDVDAGVARDLMDLYFPSIMRGLAG